MLYMNVTGWSVSLGFSHVSVEYHASEGLYVRSSDGKSTQHTFKVTETLT